MLKQTAKNKTTVRGNVGQRRKDGQMLEYGTGIWLIYLRIAYDDDVDDGE